MLNIVLSALTAEEKTDHLMRISRLIYSQNIAGLFILLSIIATLYRRPKHYKYGNAERSAI